MVDERAVDAGQGSRESLEQRVDGYTPQGLTFERRYTHQGVNPLDEIKFEKRTSYIPSRNGESEFRMDGVEVPSDWSQTATDIIASKYFRKAGVPGAGHETSARQVVDRIAKSIREWGERAGYFATGEDAQTFQDELAHVLITQKAAFNSPVWFNVGVHQYGITGRPSGNWFFDDSQGRVVEAPDSYSHPQASACFIQSVQDDLDSITGLMAKEARLFKYGSGTGSNFSALRSKYEPLSSGGLSSGMMSWLRPLDANAGATKSGGTTRRAAKMVIVDHTHPEIKDFVEWKARGERVVRALARQGYSTDFEGEAYANVSGQNSNNTVRVTDEFMQGVGSDDATFQTTWRTNGKVHETIKNKGLFDLIVKAAWESADPGLQFHTTINKWHTCPADGPIVASNPCSEYMFLDDTACNLSSLNVVKFEKQDEQGKPLLDTAGFRHVVRVMTTAKEILVGAASYPSEEIAKRSHTYRTIGIGYANIGALAMRMGLPYDSPEARMLIGTVSAILTGESYAQSARIAGTKIGPFEAFKRNKDAMLGVMNMHRDHAQQLPLGGSLESLVREAQNTWDTALQLGEQHGFRNAQASVIAPTGTIGLLMDCDTTGIEPDFSLVKHKKLAGGGFMKIVNQSVPVALERLGYTPRQVTEISRYILGEGKAKIAGAPGIKSEHVEELMKSKNLWGNPGGSTEEEKRGDLRRLGYSLREVREIMAFVDGRNAVEGAPHLRPEHYAVFDTANKSSFGSRFIQPLAHVEALAAAQPFISGAISKTVNMPHDATLEDIGNVYMDAWKKGLKAVALYRDGSKASQPLTSHGGEDLETKTVLEWGAKRPRPKIRDGATYELTLGGTKIIMRTGEYDDGSLAEVFLNSFRQGSEYAAMTDAFAIALSNGIQHGWPLGDIVDTFLGTRSNPSGVVSGHPFIRFASSPQDMVARVLGLEYLARTELASGGALVDVTQLRVKKNERVRRALALFDGVDPGEEKAILPVEVKKKSSSNGELCSRCGGMLVSSGTCKVCHGCGTTTGCS